VSTSASEDAPALRGARILLTGPTSQVGRALVRALAPHNHVYGLARLRKDADRRALEAAGVEPVPADLAGDLEGVPDDAELVIHLAVVKSGDFALDLRANAEGSGRLLSRCRRARAFLHVSSAAVYAEPGHRPVAEDAPLGDNHRALMPTYSLSKIAAESTVRFAAREFGVPAAIARLSVPYGDAGGWPWYHLLMMKAGAPIAVHRDGPSVYNPLHEDDYVAHVPRLLGLASVPATTLNWGGSEPASIEEWCAYLGELVCVTPQFVHMDRTIGSLTMDLTRMRALIGPTKVHWRDGMRRMVRARHPELSLRA
jgi:nucleoside-diphosphate-sugar epimerase